jgi:hypothetical protein
VLIEIGIAIEIDIGSIGENLDNGPDPDPDPDFDFDGLDRAALQKFDASAKMSAPQGSLGAELGRRVATHARDAGCPEGQDRNNRGSPPHGLNRKLKSLNRSNSLPSGTGNGDAR